jgi:hypothetical protein
MLIANAILTNWDVIALIITNILALFAKSPLEKKRNG